MQLLDFLQSVSMEALVRKAEQEPSGSNQWHLNYKLCINPKLQCPYVHIVTGKQIGRAHV